MAQSFKNAPVASWGTMEVTVQCLAWYSGLKELALPQVEAAAWTQSLFHELLYAMSAAIKK